jgi:hypothetical protein
MNKKLELKCWTFVISALMLLLARNRTSAIRVLLNKYGKPLIQELNDQEPGLWIQNPPYEENVDAKSDN